MPQLFRLDRARVDGKVFVDKEIPDLLTPLPPHTMLHIECS